MTRITISSEIRGQFLNLDHPVEICDESGNTLGVYCPVSQLPSGLASPVSREELNRRRTNLEGRPLSEILENLGDR